MLHGSLRGERWERDLAGLPTPQSRQSAFADPWALSIPVVGIAHLWSGLSPSNTLEHRNQRLCLPSRAHLLLSLCCSPRASDLLAFEPLTSAFLLELHLSVHGMVAAWSGEVQSWLRSLSVGSTLHQPGLIPATRPQILRLPAAPFQAL